MCSRTSGRRFASRCAAITRGSSSTVNSSRRLVVNDVKTGATAKGGVALWIDRGTIAHFRDLTVL